MSSYNDNPLHISLPLNHDWCQDTRIFTYTDCNKVRVFRPRQNLLKCCKRTAHKEWLLWLDCGCHKCWIRMRVVEVSVVPLL